MAAILPLRRIAERERFQIIAEPAACQDPGPEGAQLPAADPAAATVTAGVGYDVAGVEAMIPSTPAKFRETLRSWPVGELLGGFVGGRAGNN
jgi:hypothetical protein